MTTIDMRYPVTWPRRPFLAVHGRHGRGTMVEPAFALLLGPDPLMVILEPIEEVERHYRTGGDLRDLRSQTATIFADIAADWQPE